jgi:hypothetical protein
MTNGIGWLRVLAACGGLVLLTAQVRAEPAPTFSLVDFDLTLDAGAADGRASMLLKAEGLDAERLTKPLETITDLGTPQPPPVDVGFTARELARGENSRRWVLTVDIKRLPRNVTQKRYLSFRFAGQDVVLPYTLTNKSTGTFAWSVKGPPAELSLSAGDSIDVGIAVQAVAARHVRVLHASLVEQTRKTPLDGGIVLCAQASGPCNDAGIDLAPNSSNPLWLRTKADRAIVGKYVGTVTIGADEKPDGETVNLTIYGTTFIRQLLGVLAILFGVVCAWVTTTWTLSRLNRAQALLPATLLADHVRTLQQHLTTAPPGTDPADVTNSRTRLQVLAGQLSETGLDAQNYLPRSLPLPFKGMDPNITGYKDLLTQAGAKIALLDLIIDEGFAAVWKKTPLAPNPQSRQAVTTASRALDGKVIEDPAPATKDLVTFIQSTLAQLDAALAAANGVPPPPPGAPHAAIQPRSFEQLAIEIRNLSGVAWLVFGGLATAVGAYILVIGNLGFGVPADYFMCLFWGFGVPVSGQQLVQSTVGSIGAAFGITVPKVP